MWCLVPFGKLVRPLLGLEGHCPHLSLIRIIWDSPLRSAFVIIFPAFHIILSFRVLPSKEMTGYCFLNVLCSASLQSKGYFPMLSLLCLIVSTAYNITKTLPSPKILIISSLPVNFSLMVIIDFRVARWLVISSTPWEIKLLGKSKAITGIDASSRASLDCRCPSPTLQRWMGAREPLLGRGSGWWLRPTAWLSCRPHHSPAGLWLIAVTYLWALSEERAGELAHSIPARQSSLIKN